MTMNPVFIQLLCSSYNIFNINNNHILTIVIRHITDDIDNFYHDYRQLSTLLLLMNII